MQTHTHDMGRAGRCLRSVARPLHISCGVWQSN